MYTLTYMAYAILRMQGAISKIGWLPTLREKSFVSSSQIMLICSFL